MQRLRNAPLALLVLAATTGVAGAASVPAAASTGLGVAADHAGGTVPVVPDARDTDHVPDAAPDAAPADAPTADNHGAAVSAVATGDDPTPDTNRGADVSAVARDNHGQATAADHRPADGGRPDGAGKPDGAGAPADPGKPADPGRP
ncbi:MAG TPA: hypothetical protein VFJ71_02505 [Candidatus Limnocylindrales bacterium]|nr:hypothetical protein [Candidatus Limnocylindrales bacterium]